MAKTDVIACKQGCGKTFTTEDWRVKHELKCQGKPATSGRIDARNGVTATAPAPSTKRGHAKQVLRRKRARSASKGRARPVSRPRVRSQKRKSRERTPTAITPVVLTPAQMLGALRAELAKIQTAIAAIEALG